MNASGEHEFDPQQTEIIGKLGATMRFIGGVTTALGILEVIGLVLAIVEAIQGTNSWGEVIAVGMAAVFLLTMGSLTLGAGGSFKNIATTTGRDISHLMQALDNLRQMYSILSVLVMLWIVVAVIAMVVALIHRMSSAL
jgi:hypothetical protein